MPYSLPYTEVNGTLADATQVQANFVALLNAVNNALARDGSLAATGSLNMGGFKISNGAVPTLSGDFATMGWVQGLGYITSSALSPYLTTATAAATYAPLPAFPLGYLDLVGSSPAGAYTLVLGDRGQTLIGPGPFTIPSNAAVAFPARTVITGIVTAATTIAITTDTLTLAGTALTGARTLAANAVFTIIKTGATTWLISGSGVS